MSAAEIADNKWELESTKPPIKTAGALAQIILMGGLISFFAIILVGSVFGIMAPKGEGSLADQYKNLTVEGTGEAKKD